MRLRDVFHVASMLVAFVVGIAATVSAQPATLTVTSATIKAGETIPKDHTADGANVSPAISWSGAPTTTRQFALIMDDPDVQFGGGNFVHWVVYKIPGTAKGLPENIPIDSAVVKEPAGAIQGKSGFGRTIYRGPSPPVGKPHHYTFTVYALDADLPLAEGLTKADLLKAMEGHIVGQGSLVAIYERFKP